MVSWKQFCFSDGEATRQEGGAGRTGGTAKSARRSGRPPAGNPYGPGEFGPNPSAFGPWPYHRYDRAEGLDLGPNSLRQNASI